MTDWKNCPGARLVGEDGPFVLLFGWPGNRKGTLANLGVSDRAELLDDLWNEISADEIDLVRLVPQPGDPDYEDGLTSYIAGRCEWQRRAIERDVDSGLARNKELDPTNFSWSVTFQPSATAVTFVISGDGEVAMDWICKGSESDADVEAMVRRMHIRLLQVARQATAPLRPAPPFICSGSDPSAKPSASPRRKAEPRDRQIGKRHHAGSGPQQEDRITRYPDPLVLPNTDPAVLEPVVVPYNLRAQGPGRHETDDLKDALRERIGLYARRYATLMKANRTSGERATSVQAEIEIQIRKATGLSLDYLQRLEGAKALDKETRFEGLDALVSHCRLKADGNLTQAYRDALDLLSLTLHRVLDVRNSARQDVLKRLIAKGKPLLREVFAKVSLLREHNRSEFFLDLTRMALITGMNAAPLWPQHANKKFVWRVISLCGALARAQDGVAIPVPNELRSTLRVFLDPDGLLRDQSPQENDALSAAKSLTIRVVEDCLDVRQLLTDADLSIDYGVPLVMRVDLAGAERAKLRKLRGKT